MRIAITDAEVLSPFGLGGAAAAQGMAEARVCTARVELESLTGARVEAVAARVPTLEPALEALRRDGRPAEAYLRACVQPLAERNELGGVAVFAGTCSGEMQRFELELGGHAGAGDYYRQPFTRVAADLALARPRVFASACTSSLAALHAAATAIRAGQLDRALVCTSDALSVFAASGFVVLRAASNQPCRPFARDRAGLNFGEGAAAVLLEATPRRAPLGWLEGTGLSGDARHVTAPRKDALGLRAAVSMALQQARREPDALEVYVSHGTATQANDAMELTLGRELGLLGLPWLAHKAFIGHAMGASGLMSLVIANAQLGAQASVQMPYAADEGVALDVTLSGRKRGVVVAAAFGGSNAAAVWERA